MNGRKAVVCAVLCAAVLVVGGAVRRVHTVSATAKPSAEYILIDPGHGGKDPGASAADGMAEDDINLSVALTLRDMLILCGYPVRMTRTADTLVEGSGVSDNWKKNDMYSRLAMYDAALLTVSIHQNHFSQTKYSGTQVFYAPALPQSKDIAGCIRETVLRLLQPENKREIKPAEKSIFLLTNTKKPAVIVECGFLSNPDEAARLSDPAYRQQMAFAVCCGVLQYAP